MTHTKYNRAFLKLFALLGIATAVAFTANEPVADFSSRKVLFNSGWNFHLDTTGRDTIGPNTQWKNLDLPHDWSIALPFDEKSPAGIGGGALNGGLGWYKKTFRVPIENKGKITSIIFDGVYRNSEVWINGHYLGKRPNGYIGFQYDLSPYLNYAAKDNEVIVKTDNSKQPNSRWYSGSGIFRNVWLETTDKLHVLPWGTYITTPKAHIGEAVINLETTIKNEYTEAKKATVITSVYLSDKKIISTSQDITVDPMATEIIKQNAEIKNPALWSLENPTLYTAVTEIKLGNLTVDQYKTDFGIREAKFDVDRGFILNGKQLKIKGVCLHHDLGPLGSAINTRAIERQLEIMKGMGVNAIRTSHNPPAPELLDLCDKMGFIVMDEAFDMWKKTKTQFDYSNDWDKWHVRDLTDQLLRDRNHASVFIWSIGNEIPEQWDENGAKIAVELSRIAKTIDPTRPVTAALNPPNKQNTIASSGALDLIGYNYAHETYEKHRENFPGLPFIATETTSALETRGYYDAKSDSIKLWPVQWDIPLTTGNAGNTVSAYDQVQTPWGSTHEATWKIIKKHDYLSGMFIWTGFDYIGEPTPYVWPSISSYFGIVDIAGFPKDVYYMYQSEWTDKTVLHLFPHWNWEEGKDIDVWAYYNNADEVELFLNGKSLGIRKKQGEDLHVMWRVPFKAGTLKAISRKNGKTVLERLAVTSGKASKMKLSADRSVINADGRDLSFITIDIIDDKGILVPNAANEIQFDLKGNGKIIGVANGDPTSHESSKGTKHKAMAGKCLVVVQAGDKAGTVELTATSAGLQSSSTTINLK